jgi:hypothetical protein
MSAFEQEGFFCVVLSHLALHLVSMVAVLVRDDLRSSLFVLLMSVLLEFDLALSLTIHSFRHLFSGDEASLPIEVHTRVERNTLSGEGMVVIVGRKSDW